MAENTYIIRGNDVAFGIPEGKVLPYGVVTSIKRKPTNSVAEFTADNGEIGTRVSYQNKTTYTIELIRGGKPGITATELPIPSLDDIVSLDGLQCLVSAVDDSISQNDAQKITLELTYYPHLSLNPTSEA